MGYAPHEFHTHTRQKTPTAADVNPKLKRFSELTNGRFCWPVLKTPHYRILRVSDINYKDEEGIIHNGVHHVVEFYGYEKFRVDNPDDLDKMIADYFEEFPDGTETFL